MLYQLSYRATRSRNLARTASEGQARVALRPGAGQEALAAGSRSATAISSLAYAAGRTLAPEPSR